jgi:hypothetical protein
LDIHEASWTTFPERHWKEGIPFII